MGDRYLVIGVGNPMRGDDAVGLRVVADLVGKVPSWVGLMTSDGDPATLIDAWRDAACAVVVDAMVSGCAPGTVDVFDATQTPLPACLALESTHGAGTAAAIELGRALGRLPRRLMVVGVEGDLFENGVGLSPAVQGAIEVASGVVMEAIADA